MIKSNLFTAFIVALSGALPVLAQEAAVATATAPSADKLIMRWLHIVGAAAMLGGGIFVRLVLQPSAAALPEAAHDQLRAEVRGRWAKIFGILTAILLLSGFYNYLVANKGAHTGQGQYHMLMGIKILLAFAVFALGALLAGKTGLAQKLQANARLWTAVTVLLGLIVVALGSYLKFIPAVN